MLYWLVTMCSLGAATQGMDESVNNGAVSIYPKVLGFADKGAVYQGVAVSAPYLACAVLGCWLNEPMNRYFGRRGTIFISCFIAAAASIWEGFTYSWGQLFAARFVLGLGIGAKSSTIPVYVVSQEVGGMTVNRCHVVTLRNVRLLLSVALWLCNGR